MEEFRKFLERKAQKTNVRVLGKIIAWEEEEVNIPKAPTEFLDMYYLGEKPSGVVILEASVARELEERLKMLEERVQKLKHMNDILKAILIGLAVIIFVLLSKIFGG